MDKKLDIEMARSAQRRDTFFCPHGLLLIRPSQEEPIYKRIGVFEVYDVTERDTNWHETGFELTTVKLI